jgi:Dyp-type peroxidase family
MATGSDPRPLADSPEIQGNILAPFRCDHQAFVFLSFGHRQDGARQWLDDVAGRVSRTGQDRPAGQTALLNLGLTATGLVALHPEVAADLVAFEAFWNGPLGARLDDSGALTTAAALLSDVDASDPRTWVVGAPDQPPVDALLTVAAADGDTLDAASAAEDRRATEHGLAVLRIEKGEVLRDPGNRSSIDHFGFADGISQPGVRGYSAVAEVDGRLQDADRPGSPIIAAGEFVLGYPGERRPPARTPRPTPAPWMRDGSFQVFRRLRQDVAGWRQRMEALSGYGNSPADVEAAAIGRRPDGRPLDPSHRSGALNAFTYERDPHGWYTPLYAHIRKMNPRDDTVFRDRSHKLLRRGVPFGPAFDPEKPGAAERGLLFNAYMASIEDQFEFLQRRWANDPGFPASTLARFQQPAGTGRTVAGLDPVVGDDARVARRRFGKRISRDIPPLALGGFVTTTGAVYAFAPSISALRRLAQESQL